MSKRVQFLLVGLVCFLAGALIVQSIPQLAAQPTAGDKKPKWSHGMNLRVRKATDADWNDKTPTYGIEVFKDEHNGNLIYVSDTGSISVVPAK